MAHLLSLCGALALGEFLASFVPNWHETEPAVAVLTALVALLGYGLSVRIWPYVFFFLLGMALFFHASAADEQSYREMPWMRNRVRKRTASVEAPSWVRAARRDVSQRVALGIEGDWEVVPLSRAILLGERRRLPPQTKQMFVDSGTMHVFAISGLHVMAVAEVLTCLLALCLVPRRLAGLTAVPILWGYVGLVGFAPSAVRAATMATFSSLAPVFWQRPDGLRSWSLTFLLVHVLSPRMITDVGSVLSFSVMLAIVLVGESVRGLPKWKQSLWVTTAAWAVGVPISAHVFGRVTPGGLLANLVLILTAKLAVVSGAVGVLTSYLSKTVAAHLNNLSALMIRAMVFVADAVSRIPGSNLDTGLWPFAPCVVWYVALAGVLIWARTCRGRNVL